MRTRRARKRQRELTDSDERRRRRILHTPGDSSPPTSEEILQAKFKPGAVFDKIPQSALQKSRKASLQAMSAFNTVTPRDSAVDFTAEDSAEGKE